MISGANPRKIDAWIWMLACPLKAAHAPTANLESPFPMISTSNEFLEMGLPTTPQGVGTSQPAGTPDRIKGGWGDWWTLKHIYKYFKGLYFVIGWFAAFLASG
jgi:hypothetical protein